MHIKIGGDYLKKIICFLCLILLIFCFTAYNTGRTNNVAITIGKSEKFSEKEINDAVNCVKKKFKEFNGCTLTKLWYDEKKSNYIVSGYLGNSKESENMIILLSDFDVDFSGGDGSLNPNSTYSNWNWILVRDAKAGKWRVKDWGY